VSRSDARIPCLVARALPLAVAVTLAGCAARAATAPHTKPEPKPAAKVAAATVHPAPKHEVKEAVPAPASAPAAPAPAPVIAASAMSPIAFTSEPWLNETATAEIEGEKISTANYRLFHTLSGASLRKMMPAFLETSLAHYSTALITLPPPGKPLETYLFGSRDEWSDYTRRRMGREANTYLALGRGGYTIDGTSVLFDLGRFDTLILAAHEGWHQYSQTIFREGLPLWADEGLATWMEGHRWARDADRPTFNPWRNFERFGELREAVRDQELIPLEELLDGVPQGFLKDGTSRLLTYYAQVWALIHFLVEGEGGKYRAGLERLVDDAVNGRVSARVAEVAGMPRRRIVPASAGRAVFAVYFGTDLDRVGAEYDAFVWRITARGAGDCIWKGESPLTLPPPAPPTKPLRKAE
jgi:hypothetical protein